MSQVSVHLGDVKKVFKAYSIEVSAANKNDLKQVSLNRSLSSQRSCHSGVSVRLTGHRTRSFSAYGAPEEPTMIEASLTSLARRWAG